jgi:phage gpG-like protein
MAKGLVSAEVFGDKHLMATMNSWAMRAGHAEAAYEAMHHYAMDLERNLFDTEGASGEHGAWEGHKDARRSADSSKILQASGDLFRSLTNEDDPNHRFIITPSGFAMGTALSYAEFIQTGTKWMPKRRLFDFTWGDRQGFVEIMHNWITRAGLQTTGTHSGFRVRSSRLGRFIG